MDWMMDEISENASHLPQQRACFAEAHLLQDDGNLETLDDQFF